MGKKIGWFVIGAGLIMLLAAFLRVYRIADFVTFLGDQGRDAIIMKRIAFFEHFPAIGPISSVGNVYLGPFFYYLMTPWLVLSMFHPVGPAIGTALMSVVAIGFIMWVVGKFASEKAALAVGFLMATSSFLVEFNRFAWNPNLLPYIVMLAVLSFYSAMMEKSRWYALATGAFLGMAIQLHYISLVILPAFGLLSCAILIKHHKKINQYLILFGLMIVGFLFISTPLIIFDLRHQFINAKAFMLLVSGSQSVGGEGAWNIMSTFHDLIRFSTKLPESKYVDWAFIALFATGAGLDIWRIARKQAKISLYTLSYLIFAISLLGTSLYAGVKHPHYFSHLYVLCYFMLVASVMSIMQKSRLVVPLLVVMAGIFLYLNMATYYFFFEPPSRQVAKAQNIAAAIEKEIDVKPFQVTSLPDKLGDSTYRYFLEINNNRALEKDSLERAKKLFVICEEECSPIGDGQWDIAYFAANKVEKTWQVENVYIYSLIK